ncbi:MAG TPA: chromosomal replication initiator protein DnaA [Pyrinomonadaceae bacterium]|jgi:chromosomal replication initiator protein|nr:chromosomal replication initiator protein DnaA [Pyrinomonadaceae bacterium]
MQTEAPPAESMLLACLRQRIPEQTFETWFKPLTITTSVSNRTFTFCAPNIVVKEWVIANYGDLINESLRELSLDQYTIQWFASSMSEPETRPPSGIAPGLGTAHDGCKEEAGAIADLIETIPTSLNDKYTFSNFVVASCNRFAHAASKAVAEGPGQTYNPLYLYGGVGLGKTHLIQATGHAIKTVRPELQVAYLSIERFMNELITAIRYGYDKTRLFRERYRSIDVLLIDDIQFIAGKERTQEEFFHTFNALYDGQKQIVLTSDCPPRDIPELEERLHSRFEWGLIADIEPPDVETKIAILRRKAEIQGLKLPDDVALFLATTSKHNVRELEGALIRVLAMASLRGVPLTKTLAQDALRNVAQVADSGSVTIPLIQRIVADFYKISLDDLKARSNMRQVLVPRQVAMYLCKKLTNKSYPEIARHFGGKHHTTVIHSVEKINQLLETDQEMETIVRRLTESIGS